MDVSNSDLSDRRSAMKAMALGGVALVAGAGIASPAEAQCPPIACVQEGWRWCNKCQGLFYGLASPSQGGLGSCPVGKAHNNTGGGPYYQRIAGTVADVQQGGWSWCAKCMGFFYSSSVTSEMGPCPAGANHITAGSPSYAAVLGGDAPGQQGGWRWCNRCMGLFYSRSTGTQGVCPAGGPHDSVGSLQFAVLN